MSEAGDSPDASKLPRPSVVGRCGAPIFQFGRNPRSAIESPMFPGVAERPHAPEGRFGDNQATVSDQNARICDR